MVQVPVLGGVADVGRVQQERQGLGLVHAGGHRFQLDKPTQTRFFVLQMLVLISHHSD